MGTVESFDQWTPRRKRPALHWHPVLSGDHCVCGRPKTPYRQSFCDSCYSILPAGIRRHIDTARRQRWYLRWFRLARQRLAAAGVDVATPETVTKTADPAVLVTSCKNRKNRQDATVSKTVGPTKEAKRLKRQARPVAPEATSQTTVYGANV